MLAADPGQSTGKVDGLSPWPRKDAQHACSCWASASLVPPSEHADSFHY